MQRKWDVACHARRWTALSFGCLALLSCTQRNATLPLADDSQLAASRMALPLATELQPATLGLYKLTASLDPPTLALEPIRTATAPGDGLTYAVDATDFFRGDCPDCFRIEGLSVEGETLTATVRLRHPFPLPASPGAFGPGERLDLHVFDAMLLVHNRSDNGYTTYFPEFNERLEPGFLTWGPDQAPVDGYTDLLEPWFEAVGFSNAATLDPYIVFSRSSDDDPLGNVDGQSPNGVDDLRTVEGFNSLRQGEERTLLVQLHLKDRTTVNLQVAILASYQNKSGVDPAPGDSLQARRQRPIYQLPAGNFAAPWRIAASAQTLDLSQPDAQLALDIDVWDWQHAAVVNPAWTAESFPRDSVPVAGGLKRVEIEVPGLLSAPRYASGLIGNGRGLTPLHKSMLLAPDVTPPTGIYQALIAAIDQRDTVGTLVFERDDTIREGRVRTWQVVPFEVRRDPLVIDPGTLTIEAVAGIPIAHQFEAFGGVPPLRYTSTGPTPSWATLGESSGVLSGIPTPPLGTSTFGLRVRDSGNPALEVNAGVTVRVRSNGGDLCDEPDPVITTASPLPDAGQGVVYNQQLSAMHGRPPLVFQLEPGSSLPAGLTLGATGLIAGTPLPQASGQTYSFNVRVSDACPSVQSSVKSFQLAIPCTPLAILTTKLDPIAAGQRPPALQATGEAPITWSITAGAAALAAAGLTLNTDGSFAGSALPSAQGTYIAFTVRADDVCGTSSPVSADLTLPIRCADGPEIDRIPPPPIAWNTPFSTQLTASGGQGALTWILLTPTSVPTGFTLSESGLITVNPIPTEGGRTWQFTVKVVDSCPAAQSDVWEMSLSYPCPSTPAITSATPPLPAIGLPYAHQFTSTVGTGSRVWVLTGSLPPGLTFDTGTAMLTGIVTVAAAGQHYSFTISLSDQCGLTYPADDTQVVAFDFP